MHRPEPAVRRAGGKLQTDCRVMDRVSPVNQLRGRDISARCSDAHDSVQGCQSSHDTGQTHGGHISRYSRLRCLRSGVPRTRIGEKEMNFLDLETNAERHRFLENYREWGVWHTLPDLGLTFYRHKVDDYYIVAMEYRWEIPFSDDGRKAGVYFYRW